jgi:hypothetical protein
MTEMTHTPAPGSRVHAAQHAQQQAAPPAAPTAPPAAAGAMTPVPVRHTQPEPVYRAPSRHGNYSTVIVPASATLAAGMQRLLPRDDERVAAWILPADGPVIVATSKGLAENPANVGLTTYAASGAWVPQGTLIPVTHRETVYACNPSTSAVVHVSVFTETGGAVSGPDS